MRIHGDKKIVRRNPIRKRTDYHDYLNELREDFCHICGYCGKSELVTKNAFEIDHFKPKSIAPELKNDYNNLVYSCYVCNRKKTDKWPSENKDIINDGKKGFVDPATEDYDYHLRRMEDGSIIGVTDVGKYMSDEVFQFTIRPIKELWLCFQIILKQKILQDRISTMSKEEAIEYIKLDTQLKDLQEILFDKKE